MALYFLPDPKLVELGLVRRATIARDRARREYEYYARTRLVQLRRVREGTHIEEDHMRNRQLIVNWLMAHTAAIEVRRRDGKTYYVMADATAFREGVGRLLAEVQRIKGEGDYAAARDARSRPTASTSTRRCATKSWRASTRCSCRPIPASSCRG